MICKNINIESFYVHLDYAICARSGAHLSCPGVNKHGRLERSELFPQALKMGMEVSRECRK